MDSGTFSRKPESTIKSGSIPLIIEVTAPLSNSAFVNDA